MMNGYQGGRCKECGKQYMSDLQVQAHEAKTGHDSGLAAGGAGRRELAGRDCTLRGKPAKVCGAANPFAMMATLDGTMRVEYNWATVRNVLEGKAGAFKG